MNQVYKNLALWMVIGLIVILLFTVFQGAQQSGQEQPNFSEFLRAVEQNRVESVVIRGNHVTYDLCVGLRVPPQRGEQIKKEHGAALTDWVLDDEFVEVQRLGDAEPKELPRRLIAAFALSGLLAGLGGWMFAARFAGVDATSGNGFEFAVVTAVVIGGVNVFGGSGSVLGAMLGALLVATIDDGFTLLRFSEFWKIFFEGAAIVVAVTVDALLNQRLQEVLRRRRRPELATVGGQT